MTGGEHETPAEEKDERLTQAHTFESVAQVGRFVVVAQLQAR